MKPDLLREEPVDVPSAELKDSLGTFLSRAERGEVFRVLRHGRSSAVLLSAEAFTALIKSVPDPVAALREDFDRLLQRMQTPEAAAAGDALFAASGAQIGAMATAQARKGAKVRASVTTAPTPKHPRPR